MPWAALRNLREEKRLEADKKFRLSERSEFPEFQSQRKIVADLFQQSEVQIQYAGAMKTASRLCRRLP